MSELTKHKDPIQQDQLECGSFHGGCGERNVLYCLPIPCEIALMMQLVAAYTASSTAQAILLCNTELSVLVLYADSFCFI
ncbi:hypothetical protein FKM82_011214 [Ascaphus truei]